MARVILSPPAGASKWAKCLTLERLSSTSGGRVSIEPPLPPRYSGEGSVPERQSSVSSFLQGNTCVVGLQWGDEGKGKVVDILTEHAEIVEFLARGVAISPQNLKISYKAHLVMPYHFQEDSARESSAEGGAIGTTR